MNGIEPPRPMLPYGLPNTSSLTLSNALASHGDSSGAFQPSSASTPDSSTVAPYGTSVVSALEIASRAACESAVGGSRKLNANVVLVRSTLPASAGSGRPEAPITDSVGRQVLFSSSSTSSATTGRVEPCRGKEPMNEPGA